MAFPTTSVLDDFTGVSAVLTTPWTGRIRGTGTESGLLARNGSGLCATNTNGTTYSASAWRSDQTYGPDCEVYVTVSTKPGSGNPFELYARLSSPGTASVSGYRLYVTDVGAGTDTWEVQRIDTNVETKLGATITQELTAGDKIGMAIVGSTIEVWWNTGGSWSLLGTRSDSTYSADGNIGLGHWFSTTRSDDFGGGTIAAAPTQDAVIAWVTA